MLMAATSDAAPATVAAVTQIPVTGPEMTIGTLSYNVTTNQSIPIRIDLEKDTELKVENFVNGELKNSRTISDQKEKIRIPAHPKAGNQSAKVYLNR